MEHSSRRCEHDGCVNELPAAGRGRIPRFCSTRCRMAAHRAKHRLPAEMTSKARWVRRSVRKVPLTVHGGAASSTDPATWTSYRTASRSTVGAGLGFVLNGDGIVCLDLDHCLTPAGEAVSWAQRILDGLPATYVEVSPSGDGLHVFGFAEVGAGRRLRDGAAVEVYGRGRYICVTGERFAGSPARLADISEAVASLI